MSKTTSESTKETSKWSGLAVSPAGLCAYTPVWTLQREIADRRRNLELPDTLLIVQHEPVITMGLNGRQEHLRTSGRQSREIPEVVRIDRGGEVTYHGPGQLTAYLITDLRTHRLGVRQFVSALEEVVIQTLAGFGIEAYRREGLVGIWVNQKRSPAKIAAVGVRITRGVTTHGIALNVGDCLAGFDWMVPCGLAGEAVTTMSAIVSNPIEVDLVAERLREAYGNCFNIDFRSIEIEPIKPETGISQYLDKLTVGALRGARKPDWLKRELPGGKVFAGINRVLEEQGLCTVCQEARCPNQQECWSSGTATFLILGNNCSRRCRFCAVGKGTPTPADQQEAERVARAVSAMNLNHVVVTSVTRDDLSDGGPALLASGIAEIRQIGRKITTEVLIPDFAGSDSALKTVFAACPDVLNHNVETVSRLYSIVRPGADYQRSLNILQGGEKAGLRTKSGLMVGLGETDFEVRDLLQNLALVGCKHVTIGQYLQPDRNCLPVKRYWTPDEFDDWRIYGLDLGIERIDSGPLVRSSYHAGNAINQL